MLCCSLSFANKEARLSVLVRGARQAAYSQGLLQPVQIRCKATPQIVNRVPSCKPCSVRSECSSSERPVCNRWPILPASPRRVSSGSYEVRFVPVSDDKYYTKNSAHQTGRHAKIRCYDYFSQNICFAFVEMNLWTMSPWPENLKMPQSLKRSASAERGNFILDQHQSDKWCAAKLWTLRTDSSEGFCQTISRTWTRRGFRLRSGA